MDKARRFITKQRRPQRLERPRRPNTGIGSDMASSRGADSQFISALPNKLGNNRDI
ncbi:hypothetical protein ACP70R_036933 [Stipagrostis hirtigluma subsp. patula]